MHARILAPTLLISFLAGWACKPSAPTTSPGTEAKEESSSDENSSDENSSDESSSDESGHDSEAIWALIPGEHTDEAKGELMKSFGKALGQDCEFCHKKDEDGLSHHQEVAIWMAKNFSPLLSKETGKPTACIDCHQGQKHVLPESAEDRPDLKGVILTSLGNDPKAIKQRMQEMSDALGVKCDFCHDLNDFKKSTKHQRVAAWMQAQLVDKRTAPDGSALTCAGCHQGKKHLLP